MNRLSSAVVFFLIAGFIYCGCSPKKVQEIVPGVTENEIVVGSSSALSGPASFLGTQYTHGSLAYINHINSQGGVHGRKIRFIAYDDKYDPPLTVSNTQRLISEDNVFCLFDYVGTPTSVKVIDIVNDAQVPVLGFFTGAETLRTPFRPYMFHVRDSYYAEAEGAISYFVDKMGFKKIAVMYQNDAFGLAVLTGTQLALQRRNMETVATATYERNTMDVDTAKVTIEASGAEAVILVGTYSPLAKFIKLSQSGGFTPYFHTVSFVGSEAFATELVQTQAVDVQQYSKIIVTQVVPSPFSKEMPTVVEYLDLFTKYYPNDKPNYVALEGFINAKVLVKALEDSGQQLTREGFISSLENFKQVDLGIGKTISFGTVSHSGLKGIYYSRLTPNGVFDIFDPEQK